MIFETFKHYIIIVSEATAMTLNDYCTRLGAILPRVLPFMAHCKQAFGTIASSRSLLEGSKIMDQQI